MAQQAKLSNDQTILVFKPLLPTYLMFKNQDTLVSRPSYTSKKNAKRNKKTTLISSGTHVSCLTRHSHLARHRLPRHTVVSTGSAPCTPTSPNRSLEVTSSETSPHWTLLHFFSMVSDETNYNQKQIYNTYLTSVTGPFPLFLLPLPLPNSISYLAIYRPLNPTQFTHGSMSSVHPPLRFNNSRCCPRLPLQIHIKQSPGVPQAAWGRPWHAHSRAKKQLVIPLPLSLPPLPPSLPPAMVGLRHGVQE